jgi:phosphosulfolactate synthase
MHSALPLPDRTQKPRITGLTHVLDAGLSVREAEDLISVAGDHIDVVKLGWGTAVVTGGTKEKVARYLAAGFSVTVGGTLLEAAVLAGRVEELAERCLAMGMTHIEVSDGTIELSHADKLALIAQLSPSFTVLSEVGSKDAEAAVDADEWAAWARAERAAGAWKVVLEARESGTVGLYGDDGAVKHDMIDLITTVVPVEDLIFEAPLKAQQVWLIKRFGPNVNLGNIAPRDVIALETLRLGLRGDTLLDAQAWLPQGAGV